MSRIIEMAKDLGNNLARTDEYQALRRAIKAADEDTDLSEYKTTLEGLEAKISVKLRAGEEPEKEEAEAYESTVSKLQANMTYQRLVSAQANFDKILQKVNATIAQGMEEGAESRIILAP